MIYLAILPVICFLIFSLKRKMDRQKQAKRAAKLEKLKSQLKAKRFRNKIAEYHK